MPYLMQTAELYWGVSKSDWLQIGLATVALFGGGVAGARGAALSRMNLEDRRHLLDLVEDLGRVRLHVSMNVDTNILDPTPFNEAGPFKILNMEIGRGETIDGPRATLRQALRTVDLLPFWDRRSFNCYYVQIDLGLRFLEIFEAQLDSEKVERDLQPIADGGGGGGGLMLKTTMPAPGVPEHLRFPGYVPMTSEWLSNFVLVPPTPRVSDGQQEESTWLSLHTSDNLPLFPNDEDEDGPWHELDSYLRRQLRPGLVRNLQGVLYRLKLLRGLGEGAIRARKRK